MTRLLNRNVHHLGFCPKRLPVVWSVPLQSGHFYFAGKSLNAEFRQPRRPVWEPLHFDLLHATGEPSAAAERHLWLSEKTGRIGQDKRTFLFSLTFYDPADGQAVAVRL